MFTAVHYLCLSWAKSIQSKPHPIYWTLILILFSQLRLGLLSSPFPSGPSNKSNRNHSIKNEFKFLINALKSVRRLDLIIKFSVWKVCFFVPSPPPYSKVGYMSKCFTIMTPWSSAIWVSMSKVFLLWIGLCIRVMVRCQWNGSRWMGGNDSRILVMAGPFRSFSTPIQGTR